MLKTILNALLWPLTAIGALFAGKKIGTLGERLKHAENTIGAVKKADKARRRVSTMSDADKLRELRKGGYVRDNETNNG